MIDALALKMTSWAIDPLMFRLGARLWGIVEEYVPEALLGVQALVLQATFLLMWTIYSAATECSPLRGTVGKRLLGIQVVDANGDRLTTGRSVARSLGKLVSYASGLGLLWALFDHKRRTWHDFLAGTYVTDR